MNNTYLFIIWNKALFCKDRIIDDINSSFTIVKQFYVKWNKNKFTNNIKALYGIKATNTKEKIKYIGNDEFYLLIIKDPNPKLDKRGTYNGLEIVNSNIYDKKWTYRKWTGGDFRIHSSQNEHETKHDLLVLFGPDYNNLINSISDFSTYENDTYGVNGFDSYNDFKNAIMHFNKNFIYCNKNDILVLSDCRINTLFFINSNNISCNNQISFKDGSRYNLFIFGDLEKELPNNIINNINDSILYDFYNNRYSYLKYISNNNSTDFDFDAFKAKYNLSFPVVTMNSMRKDQHYSLFDKVKSTFRYIWIRIRYSIYKY